MRSGVPPTSSLHPLRGPFAEQNLRLKPGRRARWGDKNFKKGGEAEGAARRGEFCRRLPMSWSSKGPANGKQKEPGPVRLSPP